jgi:hypothetical protein
MLAWTLSNVWERKYRQHMLDALAKAPQSSNRCFLSGDRVSLFFRLSLTMIQA